MTEKRFGVITNWCIYENVNGVEKWLTFDKVVELLNELHDENTHIKNIIKEMYETERTELGRSVLKQVIEAIQ